MKGDLLRQLEANTSIEVQDWLKRHDMTDAKKNKEACVKACNSLWKTVKGLRFYAVARKSVRRQLCSPRC